LLDNSKADVFVHCQVKLFRRSLLAYRQLFPKIYVLKKTVKNPSFKAGFTNEADFEHLKISKFCLLRVRFLKKIQDWILKSENRFCVSLLNRLIQDLSDHRA